MSKNPAKISIFTTIWGHKSIGNAVRDSLSKTKYNVFLNFIYPEAFTVKSYRTVYLLFPYLNKLSYILSESENVRKSTIKYLNKAYIKKITELLNKQMPDVVINTYWGFNFVLEKLSKKYNFIYINIIADPRTFNRLSSSEAGYNFLFDRTGVKKCLDYGIDKKKLVVSGWFVRKEFQKPYNKKAVRKSLGLAINKLTVSVIGGSWGTLSILKILPAFLNSKKPIQVIYICGTNKRLFKSLKSLVKIFSMSNSLKSAIYVKGYTEDTHKYLQASDLVIGKAGPNLLFETVATITPFFAISHIAGQEDGNLDIIHKHKLGFVEENPVSAIKLAGKIIKNPSILRQFYVPLKKLANHNRDSSGILQRFLEEKLLKED